MVLEEAVRFFGLQGSRSFASYQSATLGGHVRGYQSVRPDFYAAEGWHTTYICVSNDNHVILICIAHRLRTQGQTSGRRWKYRSDWRTWDQGKDMGCGIKVPIAALMIVSAVLWPSSWHPNSPLSILSWFNLSISIAAISKSHNSTPSQSG